MLHNLPTLAALMRSLQQVPYLASKNMYKVVSHFLAMDNQKMEQFCGMLLEAKKNIMRCQVCFFWVEKNTECLLCTSSSRDQTTICVVETWQDVMTIDKTGGYTGVFHVLGGAICPLDGIGPEDLTIRFLVDRVKENAKEVILATNQTPEGEATAAFIASKLQRNTLLISRLARGIPIGSSLEFTDRLTVYKALSERRPF